VEAVTIVPPVHATVLLHAYKTKTTKLPDLTDPMKLITELNMWQISARNSLPPK
jgi:hypothetical protein